MAEKKRRQGQGGTTPKTVCRNVKKIISNRQVEEMEKTGSV